MKSLFAVGLVTVFSALALAQHRGDEPPSMGQSYRGAGGGQPAVNPFSSSVPFAQSLGATIGGFPSYTGVGGRGSRRHRYTGYVGYGGYPVFYPVFGPLGETYDDQPVAPDQEASSGPQAQPSEDRPEIQFYSAPSAPRPEPPPDQPLFFIGLTDNSVYTAVAYWVEGGTLNYITPQGRHNQVSVALIDRETTARLNRGSTFQLHLPGE
jgi:hypothetical protein